MSLTDEQLQDYRHIRETALRFMTEEVKPHYAAWEKRGYVDRALWRKAGDMGLLCTMTAEEYGGLGGSFLHAAAVLDAIGSSDCALLGLSTHSDIIVPYIERLGTAVQKRRYLPGCVRGEIITAIAITEPDAGSDMRRTRTRAVRDGDDWIINGSKTFITNGWLADLVLVVAGTPSDASPHAKSLFLVETTNPGFRKGRLLEKVGQKAQDTAELFFDDLRVGSDSLLGAEGNGLHYLMQELPQERLIVGVWAQAIAERIFDLTLAYVADRKAFGSTLMQLQAIRHRLAEVRADLAAGRSLLDASVEKHLARKLTTADASIAKLWLSEMQIRVIDRCLQCFGGNGYMWEYPVARAYADARAQTIYGGTTEIMKEIIARDLDARAGNKPAV